MRYLDNPSILLVPGIIFLVESILNDSKIWEAFSGLPYKFQEVPAITQKLNLLTPESYEFWNNAIRPTLINVLRLAKESRPNETQLFFDSLFEKVEMIGNSGVARVDIGKVLEDSVNKFNHDSARLLAATQEL